MVVPTAGNGQVVFSYHAILSSPPDAERTSMSPSPSKSVAKTERAKSAVVEITRSVKVGGDPPSLSYHAILLSFNEAERTSMAPSPFTSLANTDIARSALIEITLSVKVGGDPPLLSYHAILSSSLDAERTSVSPSPSISAAKTDQALFAAFEITCSTKVGGEPPSRRSVRTLA